MIHDRIERLRRAVCEAYSNAAITPEAEHPFPVGRAFAESLGYPPEVLQALPSVSVEAFSGVSNVSIYAELPAGSSVLDLGCGGGLDSLIAGRRIGSDGQVVGIDFSEAMLQRAYRAAVQGHVGNVHFCRAAGERLPMRTRAVDVALVNGIFNLNPSRAEIFAELARVVRPGGSVYAAELILTRPLSAEVQASEENWFA
jgi:SAM-dependent methyltransferase